MFGRAGTYPPIHGFLEHTSCLDLIGRFLNSITGLEADCQNMGRRKKTMSCNGVNKVILLGNAGQDAEVKSTSNGKRVSNFSLAINSFHNGKGEKVQRVEWVRCVAWNKQAEIAGRLVTKGKQLFIEGRLQTRRYEDGEGASRTITEVVVTTLRVLGGAARETEEETAPEPAAEEAAARDLDEIPF
jgi:single-strand DNA-binding protein